MKLTDLENRIIAILAKASDALSSTEVLAQLPEDKRPRGKNAMCIMLMALVDRGHVVRRGGSSKKYTRYALPEVNQSIYGMWPFVSRKQAWQEDRS